MLSTAAAFLKQASLTQPPAKVDAPTFCVYAFGCTLPSVSVQSPYPGYFCGIGAAIVEFTADRASPLPVFELQLVIDSATVMAGLRGRLPPPDLHQCGSGFGAGIFKAPNTGADAVI